jgi:hypothetical protein
MKLNAQRIGEACEILLQRAFQLRYCPLCSILQEWIHALLCELQLAAVRDPESRARVLAAQGCCHFHFWYLERLASPTANAQLIEPLLVNIDSELIDHIVTGAPVNGSDRRPCPVCYDCRCRENDLLEIFARKLTDAEFRSSYADSPGACLPHLAKLSVHVTLAAHRAFLIDAGRRQNRALIDELSQLVQKSRTGDHTPGPESDAASRAIAKLVGRKYFRPS